MSESYAIFRRNPTYRLGGEVYTFAPFDFRKHARYRAHLGQSHDGIGRVWRNSKHSWGWTTVSTKRHYVPCIGGKATTKDAAIQAVIRSYNRVLP